MGSAHAASDLMGLATVRSYRDPVQAEIARAALESEGIPAVVLDAQTVGVQWLYSVAIGGVRVQVDEADLARAREVLSEDHSAELPEIPEREGSPVDADRCPECGSRDVQASRLYRIAFALSLATSIPMPLGRNRWVCGACGHAWKRSRDPTDSVPLETLQAERAVYERRRYPQLAAPLAVLLFLGVLLGIEHCIGR